MAAVFDDDFSSESQLEEIWRMCHACWVDASESLAQAEQWFRDDPGDAPAELVRKLRANERRLRAMLDGFEARLRRLCSRAARYRGRY